MIEDGKRYDLEELKNKRDHFSDEIKGNTSFLNEHQETLDFNLRNIGLKQESLESAFRILDPSSLKQKGEVLNKNAAIKLIEDLESSIEENIAQYGGIKFTLGKKLELPNLDNIRKKLASDEKELLRFRELIDATEKKQQLMEKISDIQQHTFIAKQELAKFEEWENKGKEHLDMLNEEIKVLKEKIENITESITKSQIEKDEMTKLEENLNKLKTDIQQRKELIEKFMECQEHLKITIIPNLPDVESINDVDLKIKRLYSDARSLATRLELQGKNIELAKTKLQHVVYGVTDDEFIIEAKDKLQGYEKSQETLDNLFKDLLINISSKASGLSTSLRYVQRTVKKLNSELSKKTITHLDEIRIEFQRKDSIVESLQSVSELNSFSKFDKSFESGTEFRTLKKILEDSQRIDLINLFGITVYIRKPGDEELRKIGSIDDSGSDGQLISIKCHLMMLLMNMMLGQNRSKLPLFLDEIGQLGDVNYKQIIEMATSLQFQILTASPKAVEFVEKQHLIVGYGDKKRLRIWPTHYHGEIKEEE